MTGEVLESGFNNFEEFDWADEFGIECYGTKLNVGTDNLKLRDKLRFHLPFIRQKNKFAETLDRVSLFTKRRKDFCELYFNDELVMGISTLDENVFEYAADKILLIMALTAMPSKLYMHAGAIVWNDLGILLPGTSFAGKTTLVKEFIKAGADYYSDDCIILDEAYRMLPFPRDLAIRTELGRVYRSAEFFGARNGVEGKPVNLVIFSDYKENAVWKARRMMPGEGVLKLMDNLYYRASVGTAPAAVIEFLSGFSKQAHIVEGQRGEASQIINWVRREYEV